jgi:hypothetical protein
MGQIPGATAQRGHHCQRDDAADDLRTAAAPRVLGAVCESIAYLVVAAGTASVAPAEVGHTQAGRPFFGVMYQAAGNQELKIS